LSFDGRRISFCKENHADKYYENYIFENVSSYKILSRDQYKCVKCGFDSKKFQEELNKRYPWNSWDWRDHKIGNKRIKYIESLGFSNNQAFMEIDHIKPIRMGGDPVDPNNQQSLCYPCHKKKTKEDVKQIASINAVCKEIKELFKLNKQQKKMETYWNTILMQK